MSPKDPTPEGPLELTVHLVRRDLHNGDCLYFPASDPKLVSHGPPEAAFAEQRMFLPEYFSDAPPEVLARASLPPGTELVEVEVLLPREDLPERLAIQTPLSVACLVLPVARGGVKTVHDAWVLIPALDHTFYLAAGEDLAAVTATEVRRIAAAQELGPFGWLRLLPPRAESLEPLQISVERAGQVLRGRSGGMRQNYLEELQRKAAEKVLASIAVALHERTDLGQLPPLVGRDREQKTLSALLSSEERSSVLLVGPELVGKSALLLSFILAEKKRKGRSPLVFATSGAQLIAGMSGLGQWQERVRRVMEAAEVLDAVIAFDDLGDLFGDQLRSSVDLAAAIKPWLEEGRVRLVGEITPEALDLFESRHVGFFASMSRIKLEALSAARTAEALHARIAHQTRSEPERPRLAPEAVAVLIELAERYLPYQPFPGKAVRFYEQLRTLAEKDRDPGGTPLRIGADQVLSAFAVETGIPVFLLREDRALLAERVFAAIKQSIVGQDQAVRRVVETICVVKAGLQPSGKPLATFLFVGPTGVGKTELARTLATFLFGSADRMVRFDMSEFMDPFAAERLIRGSDRAEGLLTRRVRQQPFSVLLLDEIEKADPAVFDLLLQVAGEGRLTDARGRTAYFHNTIIIMTSNLGTAEKRVRVGIDAGRVSDEEHYLGAVKKSFRPEFVNRLDRIVAFHELSAAEVEQVAKVALERLKLRRGFVELGAELELSEAALAKLARDGYSEQYGARALRRHLDDHLLGPVARLLGRAGAEAKQGLIRVEAESGELRFTLEKKPASVARREVKGVEGILWVRRKIDRLLELDPVEQIREQLAFLVSQLAYGRGSGEDRRSSKEIGELHVEHARLSEIYGEALRLRGEIEAIEELALSALYAQNAEAAIDLRPEAEQVMRRFRHAMVYLLVAQEKQRDEITLLLQELDDGRLLDRWLVPLIEDAPRRGWGLVLHAAGDPPLSHETWPRDRRFGPPRSAAWMREHLEKPDRAREVLLRASGPFAGILLSLEGGLHRWSHAHPSIEPVKMLVHRVAPRATISDSDWVKAALTPPPPPLERELSAWAACREMDLRLEKLKLAARRIEIELDPKHYWSHYEEIALEHLLLFGDRHLDRSELLVNKLDPIGG